MAAAAPAQLSGLANQLLRRPPSLRELVTLVGYADDYAWFVGLVRRLFPQEAEAALSAPDVRGRVERFANLFGERHFPLYAPFIEFWTEEEGEQPPWSWLRQGIPFDLMGFGYDGLHEMWDGYREGFSALVLLAQPPDSSYMADDGIRVAWLESAAERIPQETLERIPQGGIPLDDLAEALKGPGSRGRRRPLLGLRRDRQLLPRPHLRRRQLRRLLRPLGRRHHPGGHGGVAQSRRPHGLGGQADRLAGGGPSRPLRRDAGLRPGAAPQSRTGGQRP